MTDKKRHNYGNLVAGKPYKVPHTDIKDADLFCDPLKALPYRNPNAVNSILGTRAAAVQIGTTFWGWPLWQVFKTYDQKLAALGTAT